jgi:phosphoglycerate kinase
MRSIDDLAVSGQRVLVRADLNVPMDGVRIADDGKIRAALPTVKALLARGAGVIVCSHLGRPGGRPEPALSLAPVADRLGQLLNRPVELAASPAGPAAAALAGSLPPGAVAVLENLRFSPGETSHDDAERAAFAGQLAVLADQYVGDAFGTVHRRHASVVELPALLPHAAGYLVQAEIAALRRLTRRAERPYVVVLGGAKAADKLPVLEHLLSLADEILIGGAMAATFLAALGWPVGRSRQDGDLAVARTILDQAGARLVLPPDVVVAASPAEPQTALVAASGAVPPGQMLLDIGPRAGQLYAARITAARTVFWNGPMGVAEVPRFAAGTRAVAGAMVRNRAFTVIGGGDTGAAVRAFGYPASLFSHVSTGGGASLEFLAGRSLPGLVALEQDTTAATALTR